MKYQDRRFTVRVGDNENYRKNWEQIKWKNKEERVETPPTPSQTIPTTETK